jgi:hypothetical protein
MATLPVRQLGKVGVVTDANPYDLPANAYSNCSNVVFDEGRIQRAPVFKQLFPSVLSSLSYDEMEGSYNANTATYEAATGVSVLDVRFIGSYSDPNVQEVVVVADKLGYVREYPGGELSDATPAGTLVNNEEPWSHCQVAGISFLARKGMVPYGRAIGSDLSYKYISNATSPAVSEWASTDTCAVVRNFLDYAIALNVTKNNVEYPTMVKWSNPIEYGSDPSLIGWDPSNTNYVAGENVLADLKTPIRDGLSLGNVFVIYAQDQVWLMEYTGSSFVFNFRRLFPNGGILNTNCVVEVEGKHYVFGENDIYVHDGVTKQSISDARVRRTVYKTLDRDKQRYCFTLHDSISNLVYFCYNAKEDEVSYRNVIFCNKAAVYNYREDTWSFMDLPNIVGGAEANVGVVESLYSQADGSYDLFNTPYTAFASTTPKIPIMLGVTDTNNSLTETRVYAVDLPTNGLINLPATTETLKEAWVERIGVDLDDTGAQLKNYKLITAIVPQASFDSSSSYFTWKVGSSDLPTADVVWYSTQNFNPTDSYQLQMKVAGRYLAYRVGTEAPENFKLSGFDADVREISRR